MLQGLPWREKECRQSSERSLWDNVRTVRRYRKSKLPALKWQTCLLQCLFRGKKERKSIIKYIDPSTSALCGGFFFAHFAPPEYARKHFRVFLLYFSKLLLQFLKIYVIIIHREENVTIKHRISAEHSNSELLSRQWARLNIGGFALCVLPCTGNA